MNDPSLKDLLSYHQPLNDKEFSQQLMAKIKRAEAKRRLIVWSFTVLGLLLSGWYLWSLTPVATWAHVMNPVNGLLLFGVGLFVVWLWTEELSNT